MSQELYKEKISQNFREALEAKDPKAVADAIDELFELFYTEHPELMEYPKADIINKFIEALESPQA